MKPNVVRTFSYLITLLVGLTAGYLGQALVYKQTSNRLAAERFNGDIFINLGRLEDIRSGRLDDAKKDLESSIGANCIGIAELQDFSITPETFKKFRGLAAAARYWQRHPFSMRQTALDETLRAIFTKLPDSMKESSRKPRY